MIRPVKLPFKVFDETIAPSTGRWLEVFGIKSKEDELLEEMLLEEEDMGKVDELKP